jgi:O-antigen/teichoic acid export membrane protein
MKLIPEWKAAWRFFSVMASTLLFALSLVQANVLPLFQPLVPADKWPWVSGGFALLIVLLRVVHQGLQEAPANAAEGGAP